MSIEEILKWRCYGETHCALIVSSFGEQQQFHSKTHFGCLILCGLSNSDVILIAAQASPLYV